MEIIFNKFIECKEGTKVNRQKNDIVSNIASKKNNFFVNTAGLVQIFNDISDVPDASLKKWI